MIPSNIVLLFCVFMHLVVAAPHTFHVVGEFYPTAETFTVYSERLDQFSIANNIGNVPADASAAVITAAENKVAMMISVIVKAYSILHDSCSPANPKDKTFGKFCELVQKHIKPKQLEVAKSYRFHHCCQENKTISVYSAHLRQLASTCNFGEFLK